MNWVDLLDRLVIRPLAALPPKVRYGLSSTLAFILDRILRYRRVVTDTNLAIAFPKQSAAWRKAQRRLFYRHFTDIFLEQLWSLHASRAELLTMTELVGRELLAGYAAQGRPVVLASGHCGNFELSAAVLGELHPAPAAGIYAPMLNASFDRMIRDARARLGVELWPRKELMRRLVLWRRSHPSFLLGFLMDQSPHAQRPKYWVEFFGRSTAHHRGFERLARSIPRAVVVFGWSERLSRGRYRTCVEVLHDDPNALVEGELTRMASQRIEALIRRDPPSWLWTHRRWKLDLQRDWTEHDLVVQPSVGA